MSDWQNPISPVVGNDEQPTLAMDCPADADPGPALDLSGSSVPHFAIELRIYRTCSARNSLQCLVDTEYSAV